MTPATGTAYPPPEEDLELTLLGRPLRARLLSPALAHWLHERWQFDEHRIPAHPYRISLEVSAQRPEALPRPHGDPVTVRLPGLELTWWNDGDWWQTVGVAVRFGEDDAEIRIWGELNATHFAALYLALSESLRASGLIPLHAAVVVRDGKATALTAQSGTGKTTTLLRLLAAGWTPLAEDLAWLDPDSLTLYGWDRGIRLWQETVDRSLPHLADAPWTTDPDGKRFLGYGELGPLSTAGAHGEDAAPPSSREFSARLTRIVRLERDTTRPESAATHLPHDSDLLAVGLSPLPPFEAVRTLWEASGVPLLPTTRSGLAARIPELVQRVDFSRLELVG